MSRFAIRHAVTCLALLAAPLAAQEAGAPSALGAFGFTAGQHLRDVAADIDQLDGGRLRCDRSRVDTRVAECRATVTVAELAEPLEVWLAAIDSVSGVLTLAGNLAPDELDALRSDLERRFGRVGARVQNQQWMMQWVRQGRMLRLTWKAQQGPKAASLSLVDGHVLDAWQAPRRGARPAAPPPSAPGRKGRRAPADSSGVRGVELKPAG